MKFFHRVCLLLLDVQKLLLAEVLTAGFELRKADTAGDVLTAGAGLKELCLSRVTHVLKIRTAKGFISGFKNNIVEVSKWQIIRQKYFSSQKDLM